MMHPYLEVSLEINIKNYDEVTITITKCQYYSKNIFKEELVSSFEDE